MKRVLAGCAAALLVAAPAFSQTLANVARQEEARRNAVKAPSKTYTNSSLTADPNAPIAVEGAKPSPPPSIAPPAKPNPTPAAVTPVNGTPATTAAPAPPAETQHDEATWRRRAAGLRARVEQSQAEVAKLTGHAHADPREQAKIDALLKSAQTKLAGYEEALQAFAREAAAAGVPASWMQ